MTKIDYEARRVKVPFNSPEIGTFLNLDEPRRVSKSPKEEPKYSLNLETLPESAFLKVVRAKILSQALEFANSPEGGPFRAVAGTSVESITAAIKAGTIKTPIEDGDKLAERAVAKGKKREWSRGKKVITARTAKQFGVGVIDGGQIIELHDANQIKIHKAKFFYTGVLVYAELDIVAYNPVDEDGKPGITAYLASVLSTGKGEKLAGGGPSVAQAFSGYIGIETDEDPTAAAADSDW